MVAAIGVGMHRGEVGVIKAEARDIEAVVFRKFIRKRGASLYLDRRSWCRDGMRGARGGGS